MLGFSDTFKINILLLFVFISCFWYSNILWILKIELENENEAIGAGVVNIH